MTTEVSLSHHSDSMGLPPSHFSSQACVYERRDQLTNVRQVIGSACLSAYNIASRPLAAYDSCCHWHVHFLCIKCCVCNGHRQLRHTFVLVCQREQLRFHTCGLRASLGLHLLATTLRNQPGLTCMIHMCCFTCHETPMCIL